MLGLGVGFYKLGGDTGGSPWGPSKTSGLEAWYRFGVGIALDDTGEVDVWADSSDNSFDMIQDTDAEQPAYADGVLTFTASEKDNLQLASGHISLDGAFVVGFKINPSSDNVVVLASNTNANEMFKLLDNSSSEKIRLKSGASGSEGTDFTLCAECGAVTDDSYWVISRDDSNNVTVYKDSVAIAAAASNDGQFDIDCIGARRIDTNPFAGTMKEIVIFKGVTSAFLVNNLNAYLAKL